MNFDLMLKYVYDVLEKNNAIKPKNPHHSFRSRATHSKRVYEWCKKICPDKPMCDKDILFTAAIFHDVGYSVQKENHAFYSAKIFKKYALENNFNNDFIEKVSYLISHHSDKEMLNMDNENDELILLLEADLLDEEGALGIVWDLLAQGHIGIDNYEEALNAISKHSGHILNQDYMVTPLAKKYWNEKKEFVKNFIENLEEDLFIE